MSERFSPSAPAYLPAATSGPTPSAPPSTQGPKLLDALRTQLRVMHYAIRTEDAYVDWVKRFILFHGKRHPRDMGPKEVAEFLSHLAVARNVSASTQNQAKAGILFLYRHVLGTQLPWVDDVVIAKVPQRLPVVLTAREVRSLLHELNGTTALVASLLYGTGMRLMEGLRLRVKDIDFERREIVIREGKGSKDRVTVLPENLIEPLQQRLRKTQMRHQPSAQPKPPVALQLPVKRIAPADALRPLAMLGPATQPFDQPMRRRQYRPHSRIAKGREQEMRRPRFHQRGHPRLVTPVDQHDQCAPARLHRRDQRGHQPRGIATLAHIDQCHLRLAAQKALRRIARPPRPDRAPPRQPRRMAQPVAVAR